MAEDKQLVPEQGDSIMADVEEPTTAKTDVSTTENDSKGDSTDKTTTEAVVDNATEKADKSPGNSLLLPIARVKRIIKQDDEITACSTSAVYAIASATELFIKHFTEQALLRAKFEKRKKMSYNDFADAVSNVSELQFLSSKY